MSMKISGPGQPSETKASGEAKPFVTVMHSRDPRSRGQRFADRMKANAPEAIVKIQDVGPPSWHGCPPTVVQGTVYPQPLDPRDVHVELALLPGKARTSRPRTQRAMMSSASSLSASKHVLTEDASSSTGLRSSARAVAFDSASDTESASHLDAVLPASARRTPAPLRRSTAQQKLTGTPQLTIKDLKKKFKARLPEDITDSFSAFVFKKVHLRGHRVNLHPPKEQLFGPDILYADSKPTALTWSPEDTALARLQANEAVAGMTGEPFEHPHPCRIAEGEIVAPLRHATVSTGILHRIKTLFPTATADAQRLLRDEVVRSVPADESQVVPYGGAAVLVEALAIGVKGDGAKALEVLDALRRGLPSGPSADAVQLRVCGLLARSAVGIDALFELDPRSGPTGSFYGHQPTPRQLALKMKFQAADARRDAVARGDSPAFAFAAAAEIIADKWFEGLADSSAPPLTAEEQGLRLAWQQGFRTPQLLEAAQRMLHHNATELLDIAAATGRREPSLDRSPHTPIVTKGVLGAGTPYAHLYRQKYRTYFHGCCQKLLDSIGKGTTVVELMRKALLQDLLSLAPGAPTGPVPGVIELKPERGEAPDPLGRRTLIGLDQLCITPRLHVLTRQVILELEKQGGPVDTKEVEAQCEAAFAEMHTRGYFDTSALVRMCREVASERTAESDAATPRPPHPDAIAKVFEEFETGNHKAENTRDSITGAKAGVLKGPARNLLRLEQRTPLGAGGTSSGSRAADAVSPISASVGGEYTAANTRAIVIATGVARTGITYLEGTTTTGEGGVASRVGFGLTDELSGPAANVGVKLGGAGRDEFGVALYGWVQFNAAGGFVMGQDGKTEKFRQLLGEGLRQLEPSVSPTDQTPAAFWNALATTLDPNDRVLSINMRHQHYDDHHVSVQAGINAVSVPGLQLGSLGGSSKMMLDASWKQRDRTGYSMAFETGGVLTDHLHQLTAAVGSAGGVTVTGPQTLGIAQPNVLGTTKSFFSGHAQDLKLHVVDGKFDVLSLKGDTVKTAGEFKRLASENREAWEAYYGKEGVRKIVAMFEDLETKNSTFGLRCCLRHGAAQQLNLLAARLSLCADSAAGTDDAAAAKLALQRSMADVIASPDSWMTLDCMWHTSSQNITETGVSVPIVNKVVSGATSNIERFYGLPTSVARWLDAWAEDLRRSVNIGRRERGEPPIDGPLPTHAAPTPLMKRSLVERLQEDVGAAADGAELDATLHAALGAAAEELATISPGTTALQIEHRMFDAIIPGADPHAFADYIRKPGAGRHPAARAVPAMMKHIEGWPADVDLTVHPRSDHALPVRDPVPGRRRLDVVDQGDDVYEVHVAGAGPILIGGKGDHEGLCDAVLHGLAQLGSPIAGVDDASTLRAALAHAIEHKGPTWRALVDPTEGSRQPRASSGKPPVVPANPRLPVSAPTEAVPTRPLDADALRTARDLLARPGNKGDAELFAYIATEADARFAEGQSKTGVALQRDLYYQVTGAGADDIAAYVEQPGKFRHPAMDHVNVFVNRVKGWPADVELQILSMDETAAQAIADADQPTPEGKQVVRLLRRSNDHYDVLIPKEPPVTLPPDGDCLYKAILSAVGNAGREIDGIHDAQDYRAAMAGFLRSPEGAKAWQAAREFAGEATSNAAAPIKKKKKKKQQVPTGANPRVPVHGVTGPGTQPSRALTGIKPGKAHLNKVAKAAQAVRRMGEWRSSDAAFAAAPFIDCFQDVEIKLDKKKTPHAFASEYKISWNTGAADQIHLLYVNDNHYMIGFQSEVYDVRSDGNCYFNALLEAMPDKNFKALTGHRKKLGVDHRLKVEARDVQALRDRVADYMLANPYGQWAATLQATKDLEEDDDSDELNILR